VAEVMFCHMCGAETEYTCRDCDEPVCEDCAVAMTLQNQIDYTKCQCCEDGDEASARQEWLRENDIKEAKKAIQAKRIATRKANWWKPENVEKRAAAKAERKKKQAELRRKQMEETLRIVGEVFGGMFR